MNDSALANRITRLEDQLAIRELCGRYSVALDDHDFDTLGMLFAPQAVYGWVDSPAQAVGRDAVVDLLRRRVAPAGPSFHFNHDILIDWEHTDSARVTGTVSGHAEVCPSGVQLIGAIRYRDHYVKVESRWMFAQRLLSFLYFVPVDEYPGILKLRERLHVGGAPQAAHWPSYAA